MYRKSVFVLITSIILILLVFVVSANASESIFNESMEIVDAELGLVGSQGTLFSVKKVGKITAVKRYVVNPGKHYVSLWETDVEASENEAVKLAGVYTWDVPTGKSGWQAYELPEPLVVVPGKYYLVAISTSTSVSPPSGTHFSAVQNYFATRNSASSNIITYANSSRQYNAGDGTIYPSLANTMWDFCVDIVYQENLSPEVGDESGILDESVVASLAENGGGNWNYGTEFQVLVKGKISKIKVFVKKGVSGKVNAAIWDKETKAKLTDDIVWDIGNITSDQWIEYTLPSPVIVTPGTSYVVSVSTHDQGGSINDFVYMDNILGDLYNFNDKVFTEVYGVFAENRNDMPEIRSLDGKRYFFRDLVFELKIPKSPETGNPSSLFALVLLIASVAIVYKKRVFV